MAQKPSVVSVKSLFIPCNFNKIPGVFGKISSPAKSDAQCCKDSFFTDRKASRFSGKLHILYICFRRKTHAHSLHTKSYTALRVPASNAVTRGWTPARSRASENQFSGGLFRKMENKRFAGKRGQIDSRIPVGGRRISGRCQRMIRWHNQKNFLSFQQFVFQFWMFPRLIKNPKIKLIIQQEFFLNRVCLFPDADIDIRIFFSKILP